MRGRFGAIVLLSGLACAAAPPALAGHVVSYFQVPDWGGGLGTEIKTNDGQDSNVSPTATTPGVTQTSQSLEGATASSTVDSLATPYPELTVYAAATMGGDMADSAHGGAAVTLDYSFELTGPTGDVPTIIMATGTASSGGVGEAIGGAGALLTISTASDVVASFEACTGDGAYACASGLLATASIDQTFSLVANQYYTVSMQVFADADAAQLPGLSASQASATASLDPYIEIDPTFADAGAYSLYVTPGVGDAAPAPEPPAWTILLAGFGFLGAVLRRRGMAGLPA